MTASDVQILTSFGTREAVCVRWKAFASQSLSHRGGGSSSVLVALGELHYQWMGTKIVHRAHKRCVDGGIAITMALGVLTM